MFGLDSIPNPLEGAPFGTALELCLVIAFVAWFLSLVTREFSWIDRLGSLCPPLCCLIVAFATDVQWARVNVMGPARMSRGRSSPPESSGPTSGS